MSLSSIVDVSDVFRPFDEEDEDLEIRRPKFDEMLNQLSAHTGLFSRTTFQNIYGSLVRMVRDQSLNGVVVLRTLKDETFDMLSLPLYNMMGLHVFQLDQCPSPMTDALISPTVGFMLLLSDKLSAVVHWNSETSQAFRMDQGGWSFNPADVRNLSLHLAEWLGHTTMHRAVEQAPIDARHDDKLSLIVSSLLSNLENRNRELTMALEREKELSQRMAEQERMAAIGQLSSVIAHEIRNPLGLISLYAEIIQGQLQQLGSGVDIPETLFKNLGQIKEATTHLETILSELTQYSRPLELQCDGVNLQQFIEEVCEFYRPKYEEKEVRLLVELPVNKEGWEASEFQVSVDAGRMRQALINLLKNALEATASGKRVVVSLACRKEDTHLYIKVKDEGVGIPQDKTNKLFTPYFSTKATGTGLGLAYVRKIMQAHGGTAKLLWSEENKGSTMALLLPRQAFKGY
jgi:signal transduction histidine kinase